MAVSGVTNPQQIAPRYPGYQTASETYQDLKSLAVPLVSWGYDQWQRARRGGVMPSANFWSELGKTTFKSNFMSALTSDGIGSLIRNGMALYKGQEKSDRAIGNVTADVGWGFLRGSAGAFAVAGATMAFTAGGMAVPFLGFLLAAHGLPIMVGTMAVSYLFNKYVLEPADKKFHIHQRISDTVTKAIDRVMPNRNINAIEHGASVSRA